VRLTHNRKLFAASGRVVYVLGSKGMGIVFDKMSPQDEAILEDWLEMEERNAQ
jgi:hypothetical protein